MIDIHMYFISNPFTFHFGQNYVSHRKHSPNYLVESYPWSDINKGNGYLGSTIVGTAS